MNHGNISRRSFVKRLTAGGLVSASGWLEVLAARAAPTQRKACILLYMAGGPSHIDTFDPKPDAPDNVRGDFKPIDTSVSGIQISEHFPRFAERMRHAAILRGMSTGEGEHGRAQYLTHTGYQRGAGGLLHPSLGGIVSAELGQADFPLPNFVAIYGGGPPNPDPFHGPGFLGPRHQPLVVRDSTRGVENLNPLENAGVFENRYSLLDEMQRSFAGSHPAPAVQGQTTTVERTARLMRAQEARAFDLSQEPVAVREAYGKTKFGDACLMARRLVEIGAPFVEVQQGGWDTHGFGGTAANGGAFRVIRDLSIPNDIALAALIDDLKARGLLDQTLIVWMGEFGRTPIVGRQGLGGRDHYPKAWSTLLIGGSIKGGQVIGRTDKTGATVEDRPVSIYDFMATICKIMGIDYQKENTAPGGRPIRIVDKKNEKPIAELFA
jgi:hypothetical protein